jgi:glutathione synthase/RimK-type ligase-like ATP-grasp enzyme
MARHKVNIQVPSGFLQGDHTILLDETYIRLRKIPINQTITLRYGASRSSVTVIPVKHPHSMQIGSGLSERLQIHSGTPLCIRYKASTKTLSVGPLIGVMVSQVNPRSTSRPFGSMTKFCRELTSACRQYGAFVYFFTPSGIRNSTGTLDGWSYDNSWQRGTHPAPDVVYNRLTSRKYENQANVQQFMREVKSRYGGHVFNEKYLNKTEVFDALKVDSSLQAYLPESYLFKNYQMLKSMCARHKVVFLKPIVGSLGKGIIRIVRERGRYVCHFSNVNGTIKQNYANLSSLFKLISGKLKRAKFQIQQGVNLISAGGSPVDFRALVQRDDKGEWKITSIVGRVAGSRHFVSNLARGGSLGTVGSVLGRSNLSSSSYAAAHQRLRKAALDLAKGVETHIPGHFAELGIDLGVDTGGKVWLIEVNSKPSKDDNSALNNDKVRPSVRQMVKYARFLAKF